MLDADAETNDSSQKVGGPGPRKHIGSTPLVAGAADASGVGAAVWVCGSGGGGWRWCWSRIHAALID